ncbi:hypothetical protein LSCM1_04839 [Leishmania martiniquensis]|uniref:Uncharacterized protein n=1 Tax=Leishmania martiniquensis TaxID=1580590 RepID=A0A836GJR1_9TRYP|nr:hypothetical protein LSCM1_04839 [Leishmania martiniquensis]
MGLFGKTRAGSFEATDGSGRRFVWKIPHFSSYEVGTTLDSDNVICSFKIKFHLHMNLSSDGAVGLYVHYKRPPIPKYSYYFMNTKEEMMRQQTAHTIPTDSERCGHWNVCRHQDICDFIGESDTLLVQFIFDNDTILVEHFLEKNAVSVTWKIPELETQNLSPYSSPGFLVDNLALVIRLDTKRDTTDAMVKYCHDGVAAYVIFLFCRKGKTPPHSIELVDASGNAYHRVESTDGSTVTAVVDRWLVMKNMANCGFLCVRLNFFAGGNPLQSLNALGEFGNSAASQPPAESSRTVEIGDKKEVYNVVDD